MTDDYSLLPLAGLREDNPRDFLAALGLLRLIDLQWPEFGAMLAWDAAKGHPVLWTIQALPDDWSAQITGGLHELVRDSVKTPKGPLFHGAVIKTTPEQFRGAVEASLLAGEHPDGNPLAALAPLLYAAYAPQTEDKGEMEFTWFSFGNGQSGKNLLLDAAQLTAGLEPDEIRLSLLGEARPKSAKALRWNPVEFRAAAYRSHDPGKGIKGDDTLDFPAFNVLAFFGLTFFPCVPTQRRGLTAGMHSLKRETFFQWPVWTTPLGPAVIGSLLLLSPENRHPARGVERWWQSRRFSSDKSLYFASAERIC
jgi:hypothetical protein